MQPDLSIYIPTDRRQALAHGTDLADRAYGAALLADISGFTSLTEALTEALGPKRGAEELTKQLNLIYAGLIAEVDRYRGSVIGFSGDAITCWFDDGDGDGNASLRATACALAMQQTLGQFATMTTPANTVGALSVKVAIASGPARRFRVGDPAVCYLDAAAGATLARMAETEHLAHTGEVALSQEVAAELGDKATIAAWRDSNPDEDVQDQHQHRVAIVGKLTQAVPETPWLEQPSVALREDQVRPWLLPRVYERELASHEQFLAELRPTVALFLRFEGIDYDRDPDANQTLDAFVRHTQHIAARYEGTLVDLTIGDKGSYLYLSFGAPIAHDDDAMRAVAAALELRSPPHALGNISSIQIGISMGRMRAGPIGGPTRRAYGVLGEEVNVSARLMGQAQSGQILISKRVADAVGKRYTLRHVGSVGLKGKRAPMEVWQVLGLQVTSTHQVITLFSTPLVGRETEWKQLTELLTQATDGSGRILRIEGAAGVGKSHLAAELAIEASLRGWIVSSGTCQSITQDAAYTPWQQLFRVLINLPVTESTLQQINMIEAFVAKVNPVWQLRLPLLGDLLGLPIPDNATTGAFEPKLRQSALRDLAVEIIEQLAQTKPLMIVLDDAQWLDESSQGLAVVVARAIAHMRAMLVVVHRPLINESALLPDLNGLSNAHSLNLSELTPSGVAALVGNKLGGNIGSLLLSLIQFETQGNPFYIEEVVNTLREAEHLNQRDDGQWAFSESVFRALQQAGAVVHSSEGWSLAPNASLAAIGLGLPDSIQGVVLSRMDRLREADQLTLKVAGVIGCTFALDLVIEAHPSRHHANVITAHLQHLEARDFTKLEATTPRLVYIFKHNVTRDVAYDTLLFDQRRQLHHAVGQALERFVPEAIAQIAYHAYAGEDWPRALKFQLSAGQQAQKLFANHEGIEHLRKALQCAGQLPEAETHAQRRDIHQSLGELHTATGEYDPALGHLQAALTLSEALADADAQARACRWMAYVYELRSEYPQALAWIERGLTVLDGRETPFTAELCSIAGLISIRQGNFDRATELCDSAIAIATRLDATRSLAMAESARGLIDYTHGTFASAVSHYEQAIWLYGRIENIHGQALAYNGIGTTYQNMGQWTLADKSLQQARDIFKRTGDARWEAITGNNLGEIALRQGRYDDALLFYKNARQTFEQLGGSKYVMGILEMNLGATFALRTETTTAQRHLQQSLALFTEVDSRDFLPELFRHMAICHQVERDWEQARSVADQSLQASRDLQMRSEEGITLRLIAELDAALGKPQEAIAHLRESIAILEKGDVQYEVAKSRLTLARVLRAQGDAGEVAALLDQCVAVFQQLDVLPELRAALQLKQ